MSKIAILGHGVVGSGAAEVFFKNRESIRAKTGQNADIKYILEVRDASAFPGCSYSDKFVNDFDVILNDSEVTVVAELIGGVEPAYRFVKSSLSAGKSVVTSNKELVAKKGAELLKIAREKNVSFAFEASVGGGIPIIRPLHQCLAADSINEVAGILNGTTNFILTKMFRDGMAFEEALKLAQDNGYAERDPSDDVNGVDACRKICILASMIFGKQVNPDSVFTEGITKITREDISFCESRGGTVKLIARAVKNGDSPQVTVCPAFVHKDSQLAGVNDVYNAIMVRGEATGDVVFYGKGAGKFPTASAVVNDIVNALKSPGETGALFWEEDEQPISPPVFSEVCGNIRVLEGF
ncbi:MAG: homoserine dehydrogenase [Oscillospiraceae bacterium]|nr:homoserine dehydrogenase [Oscillospiraceae bacterium]